MTTCYLCGNTEFADQPILSAELIRTWDLAPDEAAYMDRQQGRYCTRCGGNMRSNVLAKAILEFLGAHQPLFSTSQTGIRSSILELNPAGSAHNALRLFPNHVLATYPEVDMHHMPYPDRQFDIVVHSDTLEHVADPIQALRECRRVLAPGGAMIFTVPVIVGRMTRARAGLEPSYHGDPGTTRDDYLVHSEFGADIWTFALRAGFSHVMITALDYPTALAITAQGISVHDQ